MMSAFLWTRNIRIQKGVSHLQALKWNKMPKHYLSQWRGEPKFSTSASTALSRRKYCIGKEEKVVKNNHRAGVALVPRCVVLQFSAALARTAFYLAVLSPREFRRATEAGSLTF